ncbi:MAG TPA: hypothetical protein VII67_07680 [Acidimicrobiales bacterium]
MKFLVGGRELELTQSRVVETMNGQEPEIVREYFVELPCGWFPPKQIMAAVTEWERSSFTSHEAIRVLSRLGLVCRRADELHSEVEPHDKKSVQSIDGFEDDRLREISTTIKVLQAAVAGLADRLSKLEGLE